MKAKAKEIKDLLENEPFLNIRSVQEKILELNFTTEHNEYTISEAIVDLENIRGILIKSIDEELLDTHSFQFRNTALSILANVRNHINSIINNKQNVTPTLLDEIQRLKEHVVITPNLSQNTPFDYKKKVKDLTKLQEKYNSLLVELERAKGIYEETKEHSETIKENYSKSQELINQHTDIISQIGEQKRNIDATTSEIQNKSNQVNSQSNSIKEFCDNIKEQGTKLAQADEETKKLIETNTDLEKKITELLGSAVGGAIGKTFGERKAELRKYVEWWAAGTIISIIVLLAAAIWIYYELVTGGSNGTLFLSKMSLLIPISVAVWFTASNYNRERKLLEEYAFKSSISLSLDSYRKVLNEELSDEERNKISEFLISSMEKIYSSPLENISKHSSIDKIETSLAEKILNEVEKVVNAKK
jgi:hypothetical protein